MPRGCRPVYRSGLVDVETDSIGERALNHPAPPPQATAMSCAAHREQRKDVPRPKTPPDRFGVVAAITDYTGRTTPRSASFTLQWRNCIDQSQGFLRVVPIGAGQANGERDALSITNEMPFASSFGAIGRIRPCLCTAVHCAHRA